MTYKYTRSSLDGHCKSPIEHLAEQKGSLHRTKVGRTSPKTFSARVTYVIKIIVQRLIKLQVSKLVFYAQSTGAVMSERVMY